jgi:hypothetical protein
MKYTGEEIGKNPGAIKSAITPTAKQSRIPLKSNNIYE